MNTMVGIHSPGSRAPRNRDAPILGSQKLMLTRRVLARPLTRHGTRKES